MADSRRGRESKEGAVVGRFDFIGIGDQRAPNLRIELIDPKGKTTRVPVSSAGEFRLDARLEGRGYRLTIVPENGGASRTFSYDTFTADIRKAKAYMVPPTVWKNWVLPLTCVTGHVSVCRPILFVDRRPDVALLKARLVGVDKVFGEGGGLAFPFPPRCFPVCNGKVEVFLRTCCCPIIEPPVVIKNICEIIDCSVIEWPPPIPPIGPGPDPSPEYERVVLPALSRSISTADGISQQRTLTLARHLFNLRQMTLSGQIDYIRATPDLLYFCCSCESEKVAEVPLQTDGHFDACFFAGLTLFNCTQSAIYRVSQLQGGSWVVIYDGFSSGESFNLGDDASIYASWNAQGCEGDPPPIETGPKPFVLLEEIGATWAYQLIHSTEQSGETTWGARTTSDGLVNPPTNQPWAKTLAIRYQFHPGLQTLATPAKFFRTRVIPLSGGGSPFTVTDSLSPLSWLKYYWDGAGVSIQSISLNNPVINGIEGLYTIPYPDPVWPWLGGQYHASIDTTSGTMPNGQYLFVVDIFDQNGKRLDPAGTLDVIGAGETANVPFEYRRMDTPPIPPSPIPTHVIPHNALANLFLVDNTPCYGKVEALLENGLVSSDNCQFLVGTVASALAIQYSAYQSDGFQDHHDLWIKKGLFGPTTLDDSGTADVHSGDSPAVTFGSLLGGDIRCAFSATLAVICKHTNGSGHIYDYDAWDTVAFSLST